jgi:DNA repair photolyase
MVGVEPCTNRPILQACPLEDYDFQIDPYIGCEHYCFYCYALNQAETNWAKEINVHQNLIDQLRIELADIEPQTIYIGWNSDAYQSPEAEYKQTRQTLELLAEKGFSVCILTKSDLVTRDIDILEKMPAALVGVSLAFQNDHDRKLLERKTYPNEKRIDALRKLKNAGISTYALICPVLPLITDVRRLIDQASPYVDSIWVYPFSVESENDKNWLNTKRILEKHYPDKAKDIVEICLNSEHAYWKALKSELGLLRANLSVDLKIEI